MMLNLFANLWNDDVGALISMEFIFVATILVIGIIVGLTSVRGAINIELNALADAILANNLSYSFGGVTGCCASVAGSAFIETIPDPPSTPPGCAAPATPILITIPSCD
jgi:hypothetical protein